MRSRCHRAVLGTTARPRAIGVAVVLVAAWMMGCTNSSGVHVAVPTGTSARPGAVDVATAGDVSPVSVPRPSFDPVGEWELVMADEFDDGLDGERWNTCHWWTEGEGCRIASSNELQWYLPAQVEVRDGALVLVADRGSDGDHAYVSGMVQSGPSDDVGPPKFAFRYGAVEARVKLPAGAGLWPAVWMLPASTSSRPEIDIIELYGQEPEVMRMHLHWWGEDGEPDQRGEYADGVDLTHAWHSVGIRWMPGVVVWYLDGEEQWRIERTEVPSEPMYLVVNLAVGGDRAGTPTDDVRFPARMHVDWIRVWQRTQVR